MVGQAVTSLRQLTWELTVSNVGSLIDICSAVENTNRMKGVLRKNKGILHFQHRTNLHESGGVLQRGAHSGRR